MRRGGPVTGWNRLSKADCYFVRIFTPMAILMILVFALGYLAIALEHTIRLNKAATALVTGVLCWTVYILFTPDKEMVTDQLAHHLGELSQILFFLMGAMTIVELIDAHDGFELVTDRIRTTDKRKLMWIVALLSFFFSAVLDNLTTTIVMVSLVRKLVEKKSDRWMLAGVIIISANAGGSWSPIGDVTTTMLWIGKQITAGNIIIKLFIPGLVCMLVPLLVMRFMFRGNVTRPEAPADHRQVSRGAARQRNIVFFVGVGTLLMVPVFKTVTHLPPFMGILVGLGLMWIITEIIHSGKDEEDRQNYTVAYALRKIDTPSILFFLGILLAITALESIGELTKAARWMDGNLKDQNLIVVSIGLLSSIVDNVPLVAAAQGMYDLKTFPTDSYLWEFLAYATGTGGSVLIIGSAAGVAAMGLERIDFVWYLKKIGWLALIGYLAGAVVYILQEAVLR
jgi:NhaD family Na+/H+ antiporter